MKKIFVIIFVFFVSNAFAAEISWMYVQHRIYENGRTRNRLTFGLIDENGQNFTSDEDITTVELKNPQDRLAKLSDYKFSMDEEIYGIYDSQRSQWHFSEEWQMDSWFSANFFDPLIPGVYHLKVITADGKTSEYSFKFREVVSLPVITSRSFEIQPDSFGNVIWKWDIPDSLGHMAFDLQTVVKASIDVSA